MAYKHVIRAKTKNLFNKNNATIINGYIYSRQLIITESPLDKTIVFPCKPNTTYTFSKMYTNRLFMAETSEETPAIGTTCTNPIANLGEPPSQNYCTLTTTATAKNLIITVCALYNTETYTLQEILDSVQLEEGSTPTPYTPYNYLQSNKRMIKVSDVCQLLDNSTYDGTHIDAGITWTNNGDGTITANGNVVSGTLYSPYVILIPQFKEVKNNHKYALFSGINNINVAYVECIFWLGKSDSYFYQNCVETNRAGTFGFTIPQGEYLLYQKIELRVRSGYTANNLVFKPQLYDLTEMYGAGHEPATVAEFRQRFPNELYPYSPQCWLTSYKSAVVCKTKNLFDVNNAAPYRFDNDNPASDSVFVKDGIYTTRLNNYNIGSRLRIKDGWKLPAGVYTLSVKVVDCADFGTNGFANTGFYYKTADGTWHTLTGRHHSYAPGTTLGYAINIPEHIELRLYLNYQNMNGQILAGYISYKDIQVEQGSTVTSYVPYQHL